jgi:hypothetical protein
MTTDTVTLFFALLAVMAFAVTVGIVAIGLFGMTGAGAGV